MTDAPPMDIHTRCTSSAATAMSTAIREASGNEVFFVGDLDGESRVCAVEVIARGNRGQVPALSSSLRKNQVVIHNHPSGHLTPSDADLQIASSFAAQYNTGFFIINNDATHVYVVIEPHKNIVQEHVGRDEAQSLLRPGGPIAASMDGYELREEQSVMLGDVVDALNNNAIALLEAGTGTGKSLAYLIPSLLYSVKNRERVVISTNTINLQEQLLHKDIPLLQATTGIEFKAMLVKGQHNYLCLKKLDTVKRQGWVQFLPKDMQAIVEWADKTNDGTRQDLPAAPHEDTWENVSVEMDACGKLRCEHYQECFYFKARRNLAAADLIVTNHHMLFADLAVKRESEGGVALLPSFNRVVFDEAHHVEDVASLYLGIRVVSSALERNLQRLYSRGPKSSSVLNMLLLWARKPGNGLLPSSLDSLENLISEELAPAHEVLAGNLADFFTRVADLVAASGENGEEEQKLRLVPSVRDQTIYREVMGYVLHEVKGACEALGRSMERVKNFFELQDKNIRDDASFIVQQMTALASRIAGGVSNIEAVASADRVDMVYWLELTRRRRGIRLGFFCAPLHIGAEMQRFVYEKYRSTVLTSATLATNKSFAYLKERLGLLEYKEPALLERIVPSPFKYTEQAILVVPTDIPEPQEPGYAEAVEKALADVLARTKGGAFVLFTSYALLLLLYNRLRSTLERQGLAVMRQGETNRHELLRRFKSSNHSVLFGTDSFWEGVDVAGDALRAVLVVKLPFKVPSEPMVQARTEHIASKGGNPFMDYAVPQAILKFKQGFGRLIRKKTDRGIVVVFDCRLLRKPYGKLFFKSLPDTRLLAVPMAQALPVIQAFMESSRNG